MSQSAALKKKGSNLNKAQSPLKNLNFDMQYRSKEQHDIQDLLNFKQVKRKLVIPATSLDQFKKKQAIHIDDETKTDNHKVADDLVDQEEIGGDECAIDEEIGIDCGTEGILEPKNVREKQHSKFLIPVEGKKWVMTSLRDAWRRHKQKIKERYFDKNSTVEDMLAKRPDDMPEEQFRQLIKYWKHPTVQRATKENNEEPSKSEMFIATRTKTGKDLHTDTQVAIAELQNRQNFGETADDAFTAVFGKE
ncbi:hypothetical protein KY285_007728 [Solanum tuberosum]|nr:hypothetical protein KY285_007728 [Solanum tuberosum]